MSNAVLPAYVGIKLEVEKTPIWSTRLAEAASGYERRVQESAYPRKWLLNLTVEVLRDQAGLDEAKNLIGFVNLRAGRFDSFLYTDPDDNAVTDYQFGLCDGTTMQFQLSRPIGTGSYAFIEPVNNATVTNIKRAGVALASPADYAVSSTGLVTLAAPGTAGQTLTWTGSYYWRVRFDEDRLVFRKIFQSLWELKKLPLIGSVINKV